MSQCGCWNCQVERDERQPGIEWLPLRFTHLTVCEHCGNKRCPHATDHRHACTGSNEPGQPGSRYAALTDTHHLPTGDGDE